MENPFKKEENPREAYDKAADNVQAREKQMQEASQSLDSQFPERREDPLPSEVMYQTILSLPRMSRYLWKDFRVDQAREKMAKIYERSHEEAVSLNEKYNSLVEDVASGKKTKEDLQAFEVNELGMDEEEKAT